MELVSTIEISGEEREIADAYAREQIATNAQNIAANTEGIAGLNSNLDTLEFGDTHGGKNLLDFYTVTDTTGNSFQNKPIDLKAGTYTASCVVTPTDLNCVAVFYCSDKTTEVGRCGFNGANNTFTLTSDAHYWRLYFPKYGTISNMQIEKGSQATDFKPYIPSVKMLAEENAQQNTETMDIKMLGWTVPSECTVQNYVDSDGIFHQRVGRVDLGSMSWTYQSENQRFYSNYLTNLIKGVSTSKPFNGYSSKYKIVAFTHAEDKTIYIDNDNYLFIKDANYTDSASFKNAMKGVYLYYELATENTIGVASEVVTKLKNDLSKQCKKDDITTNETLIGTFNGKNYYRKLFTGISGSGGSITVNVGGKIEIYNYYGRAYTYGQSGASDVKYPIPNKNYYIDSQNASETSFQLTIPTSSDTRKVDLVIEYTKVDE